jgi:hypothetical protein
MNEVYCLFVIVAALIGLTLPTSGAVFYVPFAVVLVELARHTGGLNAHQPEPEPGGITPPTASDQPT